MSTSDNSITITCPKTSKPMPFLCLEEPEEDFFPMNHQVAGHKKEGPDGFPYMLCQEPHFILKIMQDGSRGGRELKFYEMLFPSSANDYDHETLVTLRNFVPAFYGVRTIQCTMIQDGKAGGTHYREYLKVENILKSCGAGDSPSVLDLKIGKTTFAPWISKEKMEKRLVYPHQGAVGFKICGMKVFNQHGEYQEHDKYYGLALQPSQIVAALGSFFLRPRSSSFEGRENGDGNTNGVALRRLDFYIKRLEDLLHWFTGQRQLRFWSSSLLFIDSENSEEGYNGADVRMIDFAHVAVQGHDAFEDIDWNRHDENYIYGLKNVLNMLKQLRERAERASTIEDKVMVNTSTEPTMVEE